MKFNFLFCICALIIAIFFSQPTHANDCNDEPEEIPVVVVPEPVPNPRPRTPIDLDLHIYYYEATNTVKVVADESIDADVNLLHNNTTIDYSPLANCSLELPTSSGTYTIRIVSETWEAYGIIYQ